MSMLLSPPFRRGARFANIGDSQGVNGTNANNYINCGHLTMARIFSQQRIQYTHDNNHAIGGTAWPAIINQLPAALADKPDAIVMTGGSNDANTGNSGLASSVDAMWDTVQQTLAAGVTPYLVPVTPRSLNFSTAMGQWIERYNRTLAEMGAGRSDLLNTAGLPMYKTPIVLDVADWTDYSDSNGAAAPGFLGTDLLHWSTGGGVNIGAQLADLIALWRPPSYTHRTSPNDKYDATSLPTGNLLVNSGVNAGMFTGTGGNKLSQNTVTPTGELADGWQAYRAFGSSAGTTMVLAKEDHLGTGKKQRITITTVATGADSETYQIKYIGSGSGITTGYSAGDQVYFELPFQILQTVNFRGASATLQEVGPASPRTVSDGAASSNAAIGISSARFPQLLRPGVLRTPVITLQSGVTSLNATFIITLWAGTGSNLFDAYIYDAGVRKVLTY